MSNPISREVALRIGLAAKLLPEVGSQALLRILERAVGLPPTEKKLDRLTANGLRDAGGGELDSLDDARLAEVIACLNGTSESEVERLPEVQPWSEGDLPGSVRVACASNSGDQVDGHFGSCKRFLIYQVSPAEARLIGIRDACDDGAEDKNAHRAQLISDCHVLYVMSIGGPPAAKVIKAGVHPIKFPSGGSAGELVDRLKGVLAGTPPPWLAKVMGAPPEARIRFESVGAE